MSYWLRRMNFKKNFLKQGSVWMIKKMSLLNAKSILSVNVLLKINRLFSLNKKQLILLLNLSAQFLDMRIALNLIVKKCRERSKKNHSVSKVKKSMLKPGMSKSEKHLRNLKIVFRKKLRIRREKKLYLCSNSKISKLNKKISLKTMRLSWQELEILLISFKMLLKEINTQLTKNLKFQDEIYKKWRDNFRTRSTIMIKTKHYGKVSLHS